MSRGTRSAAASSDADGGDSGVGDGGGRSGSDGSAADGSTAPVAPALAISDDLGLTAVPAVPLAFTGKVAIDVVAGARTAAGTLDAPMPWLTISAPKTAALNTALDLGWSATPGATCMVKSDENAGRYASPEAPDLGKATLPAATFKEKAPTRCP